MLQIQDFDIIPIKPPIKGLNKNESIYSMSKDYAYVLENMFSNLQGKLEVRFGTSLQTSLSIDGFYKILKAFPFQNTDGSQQIVPYVQYTVAFPVANTRILTNDTFRFDITGDFVPTFEIDTPIIVEVGSVWGQAPVTSNIVSVVTPDAYGGYQVTVNPLTFEDSLQDFFIQDFNLIRTYNNGGGTIAIYTSNTTIGNTTWELFYNDNTSLKIIINDIVYVFTKNPDEPIEVVDDYISFPVNEEIPDFDSDIQTVTLWYSSSTPSCLSVTNTRAMVCVYDFNTDAILPDISIDNLSVGVIPRSETFDRRLIICNGVDPNMKWDGTALSLLSEYVKELYDNYNRIDDNDFSFIVDVNFIESKYTNGNIDVRINGTSNYLSVSSIAVVDNVATITTAENLPAWAGGNIVELFYLDYPPPFSFIFSAHGRLWALGTGAAGINYRDPTQALTVYFSFVQGAVDHWIKEDIKVVPSLDLGFTHGIPDNLEAIALVGPYTAFLGRKKTQIFTGTTPPLLIETDLLPGVPFVWYKNLDIGCPNGELIKNISDNDYFISENDIMEISLSKVSQQVVVKPLQVIDELIKDQVIEMMGSNILYRSAQAFKYNGGPFCGFKIGLNKVCVSKFSTTLNEWSIFSGDFEKATCFLGDLNENLYLFIGNNIFVYADGGDAGKSYGDNNGINPIRFLWGIPPIDFNSLRFANKRYEIVMDYPSSFYGQEGNNISFYVTGNASEKFTTESQYNYSDRGDLLGSSLINFKTGSSGIPHNEKLKFVSSRFFLFLMGNVKNGPVSFNKLKLFGISER